MKYKIILLLAIALGGGNTMAQTVDGTPLKLRVATYNVGHFNQGVAGGLEVRGEAVYGKEGKQKYAQLEMLAWRDWISRESLDIIGVQEWNKYFDADSTLNAEDELLKPFYNNIYFGDGHKWIFNGIATNYKLINLRQKYWAGDYYALIGDLKIGDKIVTVMSTHIPWQKDWHASALDSIVAETKNDFKHKMGIAQKEINETIYWLELLKATDYLSQNQFETINDDAVEIIKLITSIIKTTKANINNG